MAEPAKKVYASEQSELLARIAVAIENSNQLLKRLVVALESGKRSSSTVSNSSSDLDILYR
jgi:hypothetical protein